MTESGPDDPLKPAKPAQPPAQRLAQPPTRPDAPGPPAADGPPPAPAGRGSARPAERSARSPDRARGRPTAGSHAQPASPLAVDLAGLPLANPVLLAAGTCGVLDEMADAFDLSRLGGLVTKSITAEPRDGNPPWRVVGLPGAMLNAIGLANPGAEAFERDQVKTGRARAVAQRCAVIGSVAGFSVGDYVRTASMFERAEEIGAVELNVSCPNVAHGTEFGADPGLLAGLVAAVRAALPTTRLFVKLSPVVVGTPNTMVDLARAAIDPASVVGPSAEATSPPLPGTDTPAAASPPAGPNGRPGADALCLCNTVPAMAIDVETGRPLLANRTGGLSGPAVHPIAVKLVHDVYRGVARQAGVPIVGIGGVMGWREAAEFILAGATAVEVGTALFVDPRRPLKIVRGLTKWVRRQGVAAVGELVGRAAE